MGERVKPCLLLGFWVGFVLCLISFSSFVKEVSGSIHGYNKEAFIPQSNAFFFNGGSEGIYASKVHDSASTSPEKTLKGKSFIRYAYSDENMEEFDEEGISLTSGVKATGDPASKLERIGLVDGLEEDKRE